MPASKAVGRVARGATAALRRPVPRTSPRADIRRTCLVRGGPAPFRSRTSTCGDVPRARSPRSTVISERARESGGPDISASERSEPPSFADIGASERSGPPSFADIERRERHRRALSFSDISPDELRAALFFGHRPFEVLPTSPSVRTPSDPNTPRVLCPCTPELWNLPGNPSLGDITPGSTPDAPTGPDIATQVLSWRAPTEDIEPGERPWCVSAREHIDLGTR
jgi:hypothetical protein